MSDIRSADDDFNRSAGLKLLWYAVLGVAALAVLMTLMSFASRWLGATSEANPGIDPVNNTITLILR